MAVIHSGGGEKKIMLYFGLLISLFEDAAFKTVGIKVLNTVFWLRDFLCNARKRSSSKDLYEKTVSRS